MHAGESNLCLVESINDCVAGFSHEVTIQSQLLCAKDVALRKKENLQSNHNLGMCTNPLFPIIRAASFPAACSKCLHHAGGLA